MRNKFIACLGVLSLVFLPALSAAENNLSVSRWTLGSEVYYFQYQEPDFDVEDEGMMYGFNAAFRYQSSSPWFLKLDGRAAFGEVDYSSTASGTISDVEDYTFEGRALLGHDLNLNNGWVAKPFVGAGYRYLNDDSSGRISSRGAAGYERESNYVYSPVGMEFATQINQEWSLVVTAEYDLFWGGEQVSDLGGAIAGLNSVTNDQDSGYGARGSIQLIKKGASYDIVIEPFIRWWKIEDSDQSSITFSGVIVGYGYEPQNESIEAGGNIAIRF